MTLGDPRPINLTDRVLQNIDATYNDRTVAALAGDWQQDTINGNKPFVTRHQARSNEQITDHESLLPEGLSVTRRVITGGTDIEHDEILATNDRVNVIMQVNKENSVDVAVAGATMEEARKTLLAIFERVKTDAAVPEDVIDAFVWYLGKQGPSSSLKKLIVPSWTEIERNYVPKVATHLQQMMILRKPSSSGKIILWHGAPGTGKTTALRALAREWKKWCSFHYISDPEKLFEAPEYLMQACSTPLVNPYEDDDEENIPLTSRWRLVVAEDSDEFLRLDARSQSGAALGRLLNFSDGILGQGSNTLILLTTNEEVHKLHPAVTRPGRCLAQIEFQKFTPDQAIAWGAKHTGEDMTLAEMIEKTEGAAHQIATGIASEGHGTYL